MLQRFFDNIRHAKAEAARVGARERRRVQHRIWARRAVMDGAAYQLQRVWRLYLGKKREWEADFGVKYRAATRIQGGLRVRLARKRVAERSTRSASCGSLNPWLCSSW